MMVAEEVLAQVVTEVSQSHSNPRFVEETVGAFMRRQPIVGNYIVAHQPELGVEGVVLVLLHSAILARAVERTAGRSLGALSSHHLDSVTKRAHDPAQFGGEQPAIRDYLGANVAEDPTLATPERRTCALQLLRVVTCAMADRV